MEVLKYLYLSILGGLCTYSIFTLKKGLLYIRLYVIVTFTVEVISLLYLLFYKQSFLILYQAYSFFEFYIWLSFFLKISQINLPKKLILTAYLLIAMVYSYFDFINSVYLIILFNNVVFSFFVFFYYRKVIRGDLDLNGIFWVVTGVLFYHTGGFLLNGMILPISKIDPSLGSQLYSLNWILNVFFYSFVFVGLWIEDKKRSAVKADLF
jgi:hypothetical protein